MDTVNASHFKTHFGEVLNAALQKPVRVKRRGHPANVILPESEYQELVEQSARANLSRKADALKALQRWTEKPVEQRDLSGDERAEAILAKHAKHWNDG